MVWKILTVILAVSVAVLIAVLVKIRAQQIGRAHV